MNRFLLKSYDPDHADYWVVRTFSLALGLLFVFLGLILAVSRVNPGVFFTVALLMGLILVVLGLIRAGLFSIAIPVTILGASFLATLTVFELSGFHPYEIYMLTSFHLFLLFMSTLIYYRPLYAFLSSGLALVSAAIHYGFRYVPANAAYGIPGSALDDYIICSGLILISCAIITHVSRHRIRMFSQLKTAGDDARVKAENLALLNKDLVNAVAQKESAEQKYRVLVETALDAIFIVQDGRIKFPNQSTLTLFGRTETELGNTPYASLIHAEDLPVAVARQTQDTVSATYGLRICRTDGQVLSVLASTVSTEWENRPATLNVVRDVTTLKQMERQVRQSQKMEAIGTLASGIAHDFNNILSGIFAFSQLAKKHLETPEKVAQNLDQILTNARKAAELVQQILLVSRESKPAKLPVKMADSLKESLKLMRATLPAYVDLDVAMNSRGCVMADPAKLHRVLINLVTNAFQALPETGGTISVSLAEFFLQNKGRLPAGDYLVLRVSDTGKGMDGKTKDRIFDPYFTTRASEKGTGLGLAVVHGIIEEHKGLITVESEAGKGSVFTVFLPKIDERPRLENNKPARPAPASGNEHILFVDDEDSIRTAFQELLEDSGYRVSLFENGIRALQAFKQNPERYDLVITDMTMPQMGGLDLARQIAGMSPDTPLILCTGHDTAANKKKAAENGIHDFFGKPVDAEVLLATMRRLLDEKSRRDASGGEASGGAASGDQATG